ncbi:MAG: polysaccharide pyruvyl transferase family protein [Bacteroidales bacterium]|jgi:hypothetical protein|nr:polysaccharide pyruvyl transferase family protein [Bacteroidales bacterium]
MKVATITCHRVYNHGAALQAWALASYIKREGHEVNIIDYRPEYLSGQFEWKVNNPRFDKPIVRWLYLLAKYPSWKKSQKRKIAFDSFDAKYIAPLVTEKTYTTCDELKNDPPKADVYVAGSDQIWNTELKNGTDASFYLDFGGTEVRKVSYAASFATKSLRQGTESFVKSKLANFDSIAVREPSGLNILENMNYSGSLVCDPVFLLDADVWSSEYQMAEGSDEKYVLVYDFEVSNEVKSVAERIAKEKGLKIFSIGPYPLSYATKNYINSGPDVFVALVKNATCVVSNSFHATAFSFIFKRDLFVVKRADGLNSRMQELLSRYGLSDRLVDSKAPSEILLSHIDYEKVDDILKAEIERSKEWLINNIISEKNA